MHVLVVDDEVVTRTLLVGTLEGAGYDVTVASDGHRALDILRTTECQLVVSDWEMPGLNGIELCHAVRSDFERYIYFIMLTAHDQAQDVLDGLNAGADDFVTKPFNPHEILVRLLAGQRILTLQSAELTIFTLARLAESRDPETGAHLERVRSYCRALARRLQETRAAGDEVDERYIRLIYQTSPLHDIGKVAIPDCVLLKPGSLSADEFEIMKTHTTHGARTLDAAVHRYPNAIFLRMARDIALTHHERYDGRGYPQGLEAEAIPLCGRIVACADVYDALSSKRVYKEAFTHTIACSMIREGRGTQFDPIIVDAFDACESEFIDIRSQFGDSTLPCAA